MKYLATSMMVIVLATALCADMPFQPGTPPVLISAETTTVSTSEIPGVVLPFQPAKRNFWQEFDITFWQTAPYAAFWGYAVSSQIAHGGVINWSPVINVAIVISALNAYYYAKKAAK